MPQCVRQCAFGECCADPGVPKESKIGLPAQWFMIERFGAVTALFALMVPMQAMPPVRNSRTVKMTRPHRERNRWLTRPVVHDRAIWSSIPFPMGSRHLDGPAVPHRRHRLHWESTCRDFRHGDIGGRADRDVVQPAVEEDKGRDGLVCAHGSNASDASGEEQQDRQLSVSVALTPGYQRSRRLAYPPSGS
jgi:hypothetical protein